MHSSIAPTAALSAANGDERSLNINFNLQIILSAAQLLDWIDNIENVIIEMALNEIQECYGANLSTNDPQLLKGNCGT